MPLVIREPNAWGPCRSYQVVSGIENQRTERCDREGTNDGRDLGVQLVSACGGSKLVYLCLRVNVGI